MSRFGKKWKKILSVAIAVMLLGNSMEGAVLSSFAQENPVKVLEIPAITERIVLPAWETSAMETNVFVLGSNGLLELKEGNHINWIDRLDLTDAEYASNFYDWLIENSDNDGTADGLINPTDETAGILIEDGAYVYPLIEFRDSVNFTYLEGANDVQDKENARAAAQAAVSSALEGKAQSVYAHIAAVYSAFDRDFPKVFWLNGSSNIQTSTGYSMSYGGGSGTATYCQSITFLLKDGNFDIRDEKYQDVDVLKEVYEEVFTGQDNALYNIMHFVSESADRYEKVSYFHDWLTLANCYNSDLRSAGSDVYECISALKGLTGTEGPVCEGYARAFKVLCDEEQIPCVLVSGNADNGSGSPEAHMWNYVQMENGKWYAVDVTWDDPVVMDLVLAESGYERSDYFLVGADTVIDTKAFLQSHPVSNQVTMNGVGFINGPVLESEAYVECTEHTGGTASCTEKAVCVNCGESYGEYEDHFFMGNECQNCDLRIDVEYQLLNYTQADSFNKTVSGDGIVTITVTGELENSLDGTNWNLVNDYAEEEERILATVVLVQNKATLEFVFEEIDYDNLNALQIEKSNSSVVFDVNKLGYVSVDNEADGFTINGLEFLQITPYILPGEEVTIFCGTLEGRELDYWEIDMSEEDDYWKVPVLAEGYNLDDATIKFYMPQEGGVALNAIWKCSSHLDEETDHICDVCDEYIKERCYDDNGDHYCDEELCDRYMPQLCVDADGDHVCHVCHTILDDLCVDENTDHICDVCENGLWNLCEDSKGDGDHKCDICGQQCTECEDSNEDRVCEECNNEIVCEHEYESVTNHGNGTHTGICILCEESVTQECDYYQTFDWDEEEHWESCICGAIDPYGIEKVPHSFEDDVYCEIEGDKVGHYHECDTCYYVKYELHVDMDGNGICDLCKMNAIHSDSSPKDHVCDCGCDLPYGTCEDKDKDHKCDYGCDKAYGTCEDKDKDHKCDYGCDKAYGTCEDKDKNHKCDYGCDKAYGTCEDKDKNHKCDYGCDKAYGTCTDKDKDGDHVCDYGCGNELSTHSGGTATCKDKAICEECGNAYGNVNGNNHTGATEVRNEKAASCTEDGYTGDTYCKSCGLKVSDGEVIAATGHKDVNKDHACDNGCGLTQSTCEDGNKDHKCDLCGKELSKCTDADKNHKCDICGKELTKCADTDKNHKCDLCGKELTMCTDADKDHKCDVCGKELTVCMDTEGDGDHICDYGCDKELTKHSGGTATCKDKAVCVECGKAYGDTDADNHTGETEVRDVKTASCKEEGYTGDTYCKDCETKLASGEKVSKTDHVDEDKNQICDECEADLAAPSVPKFTDVKEGSWQYTSVEYAFMNGLMKGKKVNEDGSIVFDPNNTMTRAEFAQVLYNAEGKPAVTYKDSFSDVADGKWYTNAILWASEKGIVSGYGNGKFGVSDSITREQLATMLYKYALCKGYDISGDCDLSVYTDKDSISGWAVNYMKWAVANNVMKGKNEKLDPTGKATRAECAAMLKNFMDRYGK